MATTTERASRCTTPTDKLVFDFLAGGVTAKDFELAEKFDQVALWRPAPAARLTGTPDKFVRSAS